MMITLNLISESQRRRIRQRWASDELRSLAVSTLFVVVLASVTLYGARHLLSSTRDLFTSDLRTTAASSNVAEADAATAQVVAAALNADVDWRRFLAKVAAATPADVQLNSISVGEAGDVRVVGTAATREALLRLQDQLRSSGAIADLYSPVRNLLQPTDVSFELTGRLATDAAASQ